MGGIARDTNNIHILMLEQVVAKQQYFKTMILYRKVYILLLWLIVEKKHEYLLRQNTT